MANNINIFLASSNELAHERDQIELWISRKNKSPESQHIELNLVRWELLPHNVQSDRVQNNFTEKMLQCDIVLILFKKKVGAFTREEFYQAYEHFKQDGRPYLFVFFWDGEIGLKEYNEYKEVTKLKEKIESYEQIYLTFSRLSDLENKITKQLDLIIPKLTKPCHDTRHKKSDENESSAPKTTTINARGAVHYTCDRQEQADAFTTYFVKNLKKNRNIQLVFFYGPSDCCPDNDECPNSFIERLRDKEIKAYWEKEYDSLKCIKNKHPISIPEKKKSLDTQIELLIQKLYNAFKITVDDYQLSTFYQQNIFHEHNVIILYHEMSVDEWNFKLLNWYINEYTQYTQFFHNNQLKPRLILFFYIKIDVTKDRINFFNNPYKRCEKKLDKLCKNISKKLDQSLLLDPLQPITQTDVRKWFNDLDLEDPSIIEPEIEKIFNGEKQKSMRRIEPKLSGFLTARDKQLWNSQAANIGKL